MPINTNIYKINWNKLVSWLIVSQLFQPKMYAWCKGLVAPVSTAMVDLMKFRKQRLYHLSITPQVFSLEKMLNNKFDTTLRRIFISEGTNDKKIFVCKRSEDNPLNTFKTAEAKPVYVYLRSELNTTVVHFVVNAPAVLSLDLNVVRSLVDIYKLPDKNYTIELF